jgi:hypothetical protein
MMELLPRIEIARFAMMKHHMGSGALLGRLQDSIYNAATQNIEPFYSEFVRNDTAGNNHCYAAKVTGICGEEFSPLMRHYSSRSENFLSLESISSERSSRRR